VSIRVAAPLPFLALKINALQLRHLPKDAYDIVYALDNLGPADDPHPAEAGRVMAQSPIARDRSSANPSSCSGRARRAAP